MFLVLGAVKSSNTFTGRDLQQLLGEGQNGHRALLRRIIWLIRCRIAEKTAPLVKKTMLFHHNNTSAHPPAIVTAKLIEVGFELLKCLLPGEVIAT